MLKKVVYFLLVFSVFHMPLFSKASIEGSISGSVTDSEGISIPQQTVRLISLSDSSIRETQTSGVGSFEFFPVTLGDYEISVERPDSEPFVSKVHLDSGAVLKVDIALISKNKEIVLEVKAKRR